MSAPEDTQAGHILRQRAKALAQVPPSSAQAESPLDLLQFHLGGERYAVETRFVLAVHPLKQLTPLPCTPPHVLGIVAVRGRVIAVVDLKKFFELPEKGLSDLHRIVHVQWGELELGLLADVGVDVIQVPLAALQRSVATLTGARADYLLGVAADGLIVLDMERIAADSRIVVDEEVAN